MLFSVCSSAVSRRFSAFSILFSVLSTWRCRASASRLVTSGRSEAFASASFSSRLSSYFFFSSSRASICRSSASSLSCASSFCRSTACSAASMLRLSCGLNRGFSSFGFSSCLTRSSVFSITSSCRSIKSSSVSSASTSLSTSCLCVSRSFASSQRVSLAAFSWPAAPRTRASWISPLADWSSPFRFRCVTNAWPSVARVSGEPAMVIATWSSRASTVSTSPPIAVCSACWRRRETSSEAPWAGAPTSSVERLMAS